MAAIGQYLQPFLLQQIYGNAIGCVRTVITAPAAATTTINVGSTASGGVSGNLDTTPAANTYVLMATPGSGATQNQYTNVDVVLVTSSTATVMTITSQTIGKSRAVGDFIFSLGTLTTVNPVAFPNTLYIGVSTQAAGSATDANLKSGEPTSAGNYGRIVVLNNPVNFPLPTGSNPATSKLHIAFSFATSNAAWSTGASALQSWFIADASTLAGGNILWYGALVPATDIVNGTGVTLSFAIDALQTTIT